MSSMMMLQFANRSGLPVQRPTQGTTAIRDPGKLQHCLMDVTTPGTVLGNEAAGSSDETLSTASEPVAKAAPPRKKAKRATKHSAKPKKVKVRTYMRRKIEIELLTAEIERMKKQMEKHDSMYQAEATRKREALLQREMSNQAMRNALRSQRLSFASAVSMLSQFFREKVTGPFDIPTRLGKDPLERQAALLRMKRDRLQLAHQFMLQHIRHLPVSEFCDRKRFKATNGDMVSMHFETIPLPEARGVKSIVDALQTFVYNIEISISEAVGDITVRVNDDSKPGSPVAQHRLITMLQSGAHLEANSVAFSAYHPTGLPGGELGLLICDTVDEDDLFPYRPAECLQQDMTMIMMLEWRRNDKGLPIIVLSRWWCLRIRQSNVYISPTEVERFRSGEDKVAEAILSTVKHAAAVSR